MGIISTTEKNIGYQDSMETIADGYNIASCFPMNASGLQVGDRLIHKGGQVERVLTIYDDIVTLEEDERQRKALRPYLQHFINVGILKLERPRKQRVRI